MGGLDSKDIAPKVGISDRHVRRILSDDRVKRLLDSTHRIYASHLKGIGKQFLRLCYDDDKAVKGKAISEYHKIMGITPAHTQSIFIGNIYQQTNLTADPQLLAMLGRALGVPNVSHDSSDQGDDEAVDVTPVDNGNDIT